MDGAAGALLFLPEAVERAAVTVGGGFFGRAELGGAWLRGGSTVVVGLFLVVFGPNVVGDPVLLEELGLRPRPTCLVIVDDDDIVYL